MTYATYLWNSGNTTYVTDTLWPIIELDLNYVADNWNQSTCVHVLSSHHNVKLTYHCSRFDLWEEVDSSSFFTTAVQHRSLREGIIFANLISETSDVSNWATQADSLLCFLQVR